MIDDHDSLPDMADVVAGYSPVCVGIHTSHDVCESIFLTASRIVGSCRGYNQKPALDL